MNHGARDPEIAHRADPSESLPWRGWLGTYGLSRGLILAAAVVSIALVPAARREETPLTSVWDGAWYVSIAEHGYLPDPSVVRPPGPADADTSYDGAVAFLPLFPAVVAAIGEFAPVSLDVVAAVLAFVFGGAAIIAFGVVARDCAPQAVSRAVPLFAFFPGAFVLSLAYAEGLFITLSCLCLISLKRARWVWAGIAGALASATRPNGLALTVACAVAAFVAMQRGGGIRPLIAPLLAPTGIAGYFGYLWLESGDPLYWFRANARYWNDSFGSWPEIRVLLGGSHAQVSGGAARVLLFGGLALGLVVLSWLIWLMFRARLPAPAVAYALAYEGMALTTQFLAPRPRFVFTAFPLVIGLAVALRATIYRGVLIASAAGMALLFCFYTVTYYERPLVAP